MSELFELHTFLRKYMFLGIMSRRVNRFVELVIVLIQEIIDLRKFKSKVIPRSETL